jgi:hypothetical protein
MKEKRLSRVLTISLIVSLGILLSFCFSGYAQFLPYIPVTMQTNYVQTTPFTTSSLNSSYYRDIYTMYGTQNTAFSNPFATYGSSSMQYADPFSQAAANTMTYQNVFGVSLNQGQGFYRDPFYSTGGKYINYSSLAGGFSSDMGYTMTPVGGTTHLGSSLTTPWTHIHTNIDTAAGIAGAGIGVEHAAFGMPTVFNAMGFNPAVAGQLSLMAFGSETAAMDRMLGNTYAYTKEGMAYIPVASYYNANSVGGTNYFFAGDISYQETGVVGSGPFATGYSIVQEVPDSLVGLAGASLATSAALSGAFLGSGVTASPYGGWTGGTTAASTGAGGVYAGWGAPSAGSFGVVSGGWGGFTGGGFATGGGVFAGGGFGGAAFGVGGGGAVSGGGFTSGTGVSYGGAPGLGW